MRRLVGRLSPSGALELNGSAGGARDMAFLEGEGPSSEEILACYRRAGLPAALKLLDGAFALALWDAGARKLLLARDRAGLMPLYYAEDPGALHFGCALSDVQNLRPRRAEASAAGIEAFLTLKFVPSPGTLIEGLKKVPPGHYLEASSAGVRLHPYWSPLGGPASGGSAVDAVDETLAASVSRQFNNGEPAGLFLSGGVDSSLIAHHLAKGGARKVAAYTIGYSDLPGQNEFDDAAIIARKYPLDHREVVVSSGDALSVLEDEAHVFDDPVADSLWVPLHFLSRQAKQDGLRAVMVGDGSDELFFGADSMRRGLRDLRRFRSTAWRGLARAAYRLGQPVYALTHRGHKRFDLWRRAALGAPLYWGSSMGFRRTERRYVAGPALGPAGADPAGDFIGRLYQRYEREARDPEDIINLVCFVEFETRLSEASLQRVGRVAAAHSLAPRAPFLDRALCELAFSIPGETKAPGGRSKMLLKEVALRHLPPPAVQRLKMGFSLPLAAWLRGPLAKSVAHSFESSRLFKDEWLDGPFCRRLLHEHLDGQRDHAHLLWLLYSLSRWYDRWIA